MVDGILMLGKIKSSRILPVFIPEIKVETLIYLED
jgi:hypothetical protein